MTTARRSAAPFRALILCAGAWLLAACGQPATQQTAGPVSGGEQAGCQTRAYSEIGGPISLVDHKGQTVSEADFKGRPAMIYFGFTYCPDICPTTLVTLKRAYNKLPDGIAPPQTLLISVDPERDTPEAMATYVSTEAFPEDLTGLTGSPEQVRAAADAFIADYQRIEATGSLSEYTMDHTSILYLMDEDWSLKTYFTHQDTEDSIAACLAEHLG